MLGIITQVQETRFKLADDSGRTKLFILSHSAAIEPQDIIEIAERRERVMVSFELLDNRIAGVAKEIRTAENTSARATAMEVVAR